MIRYALLATLVFTNVVRAENPLDEKLRQYQQAHHLAAPAPISDHLFIRRVTLDLVGILPTPERVDAFLTSTSPTKREEYINELLADQRNYAEHWLTFWSDSLRNAYRGTGFIDNGRLQITHWLYGALYHNKPFDQFVHELISPVPASEGFTKGILWRGVVNESQRKEIQAAQTIAHVFMGANLKCASCHDSFVDKWLLSDAYGMAAVFADAPLMMHECEKPIEETATARFFLPEVGALDATATRQVRMQQFADLVVSDKNERFSRTLVNRLWANLMGRGLVHPVDNLDLNSPWSEELLDLLAKDFVEHGYDLKHTLRLITTSVAYSMPADTSAPQENFVFQGPLPKRMTAEQFTDALSYLTGIQPPIPPAGIHSDGRNQGGQFEAALQVLEAATDRELLALPDDVTNDKIVETLTSAEWIWSDAQALQAPGQAQAWFRKTFALENVPKTALAILTADNEFTLFVNGQESLTGNNWAEPLVIDLTDMLRKGENVISLQVKNGTDAPNPAGLLGTILVQVEGADWQTIPTSADWLASIKPEGNWKAIKYDAATWVPAHVIGKWDTAPWSINTSIDKQNLSLKKGSFAGRWGEDRVRAALLFRDDFQSSLGRPNREQVVTTRDSQATLLQALELTNGTTLDELLLKGAQLKITADKPDANAIISEIYRTALSRIPTSEELSIAQEILGDDVSPSNLSPSSIADLLWNVVMLPEFQVIY